MRWSARGDGVLVVLDDDERVAVVAEVDEGFEQGGVVARVEADGGFVEHVEHAAEVGAELGGEADALGLAAGEGVAGAVELEVAEADFLEEGEALADLGQDVAGDECVAVAGEVEVGEMGGGGVDGEVGEVGDGDGVLRT